MTDAPLILWFRRDFRLADHPMLTAAVKTGRPLLPLVILDPETEGLGAAPLWRWGLAVEAFAAALDGVGARMVLRRGPALEVLRAVMAETGAVGAMWSRLYDPASVARDTAVKAALRAEGRLAVSHPGHLLFEPWEVATGEGGPYRVYSPFWRAVRGILVAGPEPAPVRLAPPLVRPASDRLADWRLAARMGRGAAVVRPHVRLGEAAALARLDAFLSGPVCDYSEARNLPAVAGTSRLSEHLALGEIGARTVWHAGMHLLDQVGRGAETFLKEVVWREFSYHLMHHFPQITTRNWKPEWDSFPWLEDNPGAERWRRGMTGEPFVDAAMREMYVTGTMHNRGRMIVASYLTKHMMTDWRVGLAWFEDCLIDWDPAANAMGWQWAAGSGPDAAPYFRIFNPATQAEKFDPDRRYREGFIAELARHPGAQALSYFDAVPKSWCLSRGLPYISPLVDLAEGRTRALAAYSLRKT